MLKENKVKLMLNLKGMRNREIMWRMLTLKK
jgi:hypothetical protein